VTSIVDVDVDLNVDSTVDNVDADRGLSVRQDLGGARMVDLRGMPASRSMSKCPLKFMFRSMSTRGP
jgi:hypothetical protein